MYFFDCCHLFAFRYFFNKDANFQEKMTRALAGAEAHAVVPNNLFTSQSSIVAIAIVAIEWATNNVTKLVVTATRQSSSSQYPAGDGEGLRRLPATTVQLVQ